MKPSVLLLSTYPFVEPQHGGQLRLAAISDAFIAAGWEVESLAIYGQESYIAQQHGPRDIAFPVNSPYRRFHGRDVPLINDLLNGGYAVADDGGFPAILASLPRKIDVIHVEQPWLWPLAQRIRQLPGYGQVRLIFGSQNIEAPLKREILDSYQVSSVDDVIAEIDALERCAAREADLSVAVTQRDLDTLIAWGARRPLLAPNGINPWRADPERAELWRARLPQAPWMLYVASAHPPNFKGFIQCVGASLGCLAPDSRLVVAGSVCEPLYQHLAATRWHSLNLSRMQLLYVLSNDDLAAVKSLAHVFLLPISHGGGSNIKTAEALYSGAHVIGSEAAFRGFEPYMQLPEVTAARNAGEFQAAIRAVLASPPALPDEDGRKLREVLRWDRSVASIPAAAAALLNGEAR